MAKLGRPPTPTRLHILRGNPGKRKHPANEPQPPASIPVMPSWLSKEAKTEWRWLAPKLGHVDLMSEMYRSTLAAFCEAVGAFVRATKRLQREGEIVTEPIQNRHGDKIGERLRAHPCVKLQRDAFGRIKQFLGEFGLSPSSIRGLGNASNAPKETEAAKLAAQAAANRARTKQVG